VSMERARQFYPVLLDDGGGSYLNVAVIANYFYFVCDGSFCYWHNVKSFVNV
jgi:hypothetical protein